MDRTRDLLAPSVSPRALVPEADRAVVALVGLLKAMDRELAAEAAPNGDLERRMRLAASQTKAIARARALIEEAEARARR